jgi:hypothetical protein
MGDKMVLSEPIRGRGSQEKQRKENVAAENSSEILVSI